MPRVAFAAVFVMFSFFKGCDISGGPQAVRQKFEDALHPYFVNAKAQAIPEKQLIIGLSCIQGAGPELVSKVADFLVSNQQLAQLRTLRTYGPILGSPSYKYVALGFDSWVIRLDVDTWRISYHRPWLGYSEQYAATCGLSPTQSPEPVAQGGDAIVGSGRVWIGTFKVHFSKPFNGVLELVGQDSLGMYQKDSDFEARKDAEVSAREELIRAQFAAQNVSVESIELTRIDKFKIHR